MSQAITTQAQAVTTQDQAMIAQANREVVPLANKHVWTMASRLTNIKRMNYSTFYGSKVQEDPQDFIDETNKIIYGTRLTTHEKAELAPYQIKDVAQSWSSNGKTIGP